MQVVIMFLTFIACLFTAGMFSLGAFIVIMRVFFRIAGHY